MPKVNLNISTMYKNLDAMEEAMTEKKYPIDGFDFSIIDYHPDDPRNDTCYTKEFFLEHNLIEKGMPSVDGFLYVNDEVRNYIEVWKEHNE